MEGGVIQQCIEGMGTSDDVSLWLVASFSEFAPEARKWRDNEKNNNDKNKSMGVLNLQTLSAFYVVNMQTLSATYPYISF